MDDDARSTFEFASITDRLPQPIVVLDRSATIRYANASAGHLLQIAPTSLVGTSALSLVHQRDRRRLQRDLAASASGVVSDRPSVYRVRSADGSWKHVLVVASPVAQEDNGILLAATDVTQQVEEASEFEDLALRDSITDLPNRRAITSLVERTLSEPNVRLGVAFIDLDHFRRVNDCYNHTVGDEVLRAAAARLRLATPLGCSLGHFGADNFVAVFVGHEEGSATRVLWELVTRLANPMFVSGHELRVTATAGIAFSDSTSTCDTLLRDADVALTKAKAERRGGFTAFTEEMGRETADRLEIEIDLSHALERKELRVVYQPIVSLLSGTVESREALLRWDRRLGRTVAPQNLLPWLRTSG